VERKKGSGGMTIVGEMGTRGRGKRVLAFKWKKNFTVEWTEVLGRYESCARETREILVRK